MKSQIERDGFCVLEVVISEGEIAAICDEMLTAVELNHALSGAEKSKTERRGHRIGTPGVVSMKQMINEVQSFPHRRVCEVLIDSAYQMICNCVQRIQLTPSSTHQCTVKTELSSIRTPIG